MHNIILGNQKKKFVAVCCGISKLTNIIIYVGTLVKTIGKMTEEPFNIK